ncbi:hypothetical protein [Massilia sp. CCM 8734]|uniref:hypothetical protein n=1 Tax=Massilia sp. CCM 8734 TaxID=2609283 RepID=UPI0014210163|nr:hypothetical protein [Massilia sp. CCM 8734]NIA00196.1 hypothetical protein [Massilia sp. CCM 8734]
MTPELPDISDSRAPWQYRLIGAILYVLAIMFTYRLFTLHDQGAGLDKAMLTALGAIALPLFAIALAATLPQFYSLGPKEEGSAQFQVGWIVLIPGYALHLTLSGQFELVSWWPLILVGLAGGFLLACLISRLRFNILYFVCIMGFGSAYVSGAVLFINCMFDYKPAEVTTQRHADARVNPAAFTVKLDRARPHGLSQLRLTSFDFGDTRDGICVRVYRGTLFLGWYTADPYRDCPGNNPRLDDVMHSKAQLCSAGHEHACLALAKFKAGKHTADELATNWAEMACFKGERQQCELLCARGKKYLNCANQEWRIIGRDWTVVGWTAGSGPDGRYLAQVMISCTAPVSAAAQPALKPVQRSIEYDGEQFRSPVTKRMHNTLGEALSEVCAAVPARKAPNYLLLRPYKDERPPEARGRPTATSVHKCQAADGKITLTDTACPKGRE